MPELRFPITDQDHVVGPADAPVTLVEYGDYQCPHCQAAWPQVELVLRHFGNELRYAYRHFPISTMHPLARPAAETAEFAGAHGLFWQMHSGIYANGHQLSGGTLLALANQLGLDVAELRQALAQGTYAPKVDADFAPGGIPAHDGRVEVQLVRLERRVAVEIVGERLLQILLEGGGQLQQPSQRLPAR